MRRYAHCDGNLISFLSIYAYVHKLCVGMQTRAYAETRGGHFTTLCFILVTGFLIESGACYLSARLVASKL